MNIAERFALRERPRRLRSSPAMRALVRETHDQSRRSGAAAVHRARPRRSLADRIDAGGFTLLGRRGGARSRASSPSIGVRSVLLFGVPDDKDAIASGNYDPNGLVQSAARAIKDALPQMLVIADLCNCEYTDHGHCGIIDERGDVDNDRTLEILMRTAHHVTRQAGVDIVAPSDMMDGRIGAIRGALDGDGYSGTTIMSYAAKYASAFYGPFREAADSRRPSATGAPIRWIRPTAAKRRAKFGSTSPKAPTS